MSVSERQKLEVSVEVNQLEGGEIELAVQLLPEPVLKAKERALKSFARQASIPGFRKGKAPRAVLERFLDQEALKQNIIDTLLPDAYEAALEKVNLKPLDHARISEVEFADDSTLTFKATVTLRPEITLGDYKGLSATCHISPVTEAQIEAEIERMRSRLSKFVDLPEGAGIEKGDLAVVDYEMLIEGKKKEDGSTSGYPLEVGVDELFPELNKELLGARAGETREFSIDYPQGHSDTAVAGKSARFNVTVKAARRRQLPELDGEFAKQTSGLDSMEALRDRLRENLEAIGRAIAEEDVRNQLIRQISESASLDVPQALVDREVDYRIDDITEELERRKLTLHQHLQNLGRSFEDWRADIEVVARQAARHALVLDEIGTREKIAVTDDELDAEIHRIAEAENLDADRVHERLHNSAEINRLTTRLYHRKIIQFLVDHAQIKEEITEPQPEEAPASVIAAETATPILPQK